MNEKTKVIVEEKFIFNNDILPEKLSHASGIFKNKHYKGVFIPKLSVEVKEGIQSNITRVVPVIICSDHTHHEITKPFCDSFKAK